MAASEKNLSLAARRASGLCGACNEAPSCMHLEQSCASIWFCSHFSDPEPPGRRSVLLRSVTEAPALTTTSGATADGAAELAGLCGNCQARVSCTMPKPAGGIWHCEEHQ